MKTLLVVLTAALCACSAAGEPAVGPATTAPTSIVSATAASEPTTPTSLIDSVPRALPESAEGMAEELIRAERTIREPELRDDNRAGWGRRQQRLYRHLGVNEDWAGEVLIRAARRAPTSVALAIERNWTARKELSALTTSGSLSSVLPAWRIREPLPSEDLLGYYQWAEGETGIEWVYLAAIHLVETRMGRIEGLSTAGATGPMQFLPSTWEECCEGDPTVDRDAILGAATYLVDRGGPQEMEKALRGYNNSDYYVRAVSAYAEVLRDDPRAYYGYHAWEVFFRSDAGLVRLPVGYYEPEPVDASAWIVANPQHLVE